MRAGRGWAGGKVVSQRGRKGRTLGKKARGGSRKLKSVLLQETERKKAAKGRGRKDMKIPSPANRKLNLKVRGGST